MWKLLGFIASSFENSLTKTGEKFEKHENTIMPLLFLIPILAILFWFCKAAYWTITHHGQGLF